MHKNYSTVIFSFVLILFIILTVINYHNNDVLESRINTIHKHLNAKNNIDNFDSEKNFKEDYYITQQAHDTNVILVFFGLFVAITGFFTYKSIVDRFDYKSIELNREIQAHKKILIHDIGMLKKEFYSDGADIDNERGQKFLQEGNLGHYVSYTLSCVKKNYQYYLHLLVIEPDSKHEYMTDINIELLQEIKAELKDNLSISDSTYGVIQDHMREIRRIENNQIDKLLSSIDSKLLSIPNEEYYKK
ncbi:MAG: hypothetical protein REI96_14210 [Flavobacterium nitrogenifigens]|uniref:hypothetical protein n=1 Tax=Flavobacterium nitrogenifigens TaxID=1617283 RepID=UPI00280879A6|nr:hypothetical protein [Flavobacterium nitrogenifigens]MDQ8013601.1 hypothetical protein [Flavobacterium nitrogenifigens]